MSSLDDLAQATPSLIIDGGDIVIVSDPGIINGTDIIDDVVKEVNYNLLLVSPFILIPLSIIFARLCKYLYRIYLAKYYGYGKYYI
jgi:hypothetical protein